MNHIMQKLILASASKARAKLLSQMELKYEIIPSYVDETIENSLDPEEIVKELALRKAKKVSQSCSNALILGFDTMIYFNGEIIGKPKNKDQARNILLSFSDNNHIVYTGIAIIDTESKKIISDVEKTIVHFRSITEEEIEHYLDNEAYLEKAGSYSILEKAAFFVDSIEGCFFSVVGIPLAKLAKDLKHFNYKVL